MLEVWVEALTTRSSSAYYRRKETYKGAKETWVEALTTRSSSALAPINAMLRPYQPRALRCSPAAKRALPCSLRIVASCMRPSVVCSSADASKSISTVYTTAVPSCKKEEEQECVSNVYTTAVPCCTAHVVVAFSKESYNRSKRDVVKETCTAHVLLAFRVSNECVSVTVISAFKIKKNIASQSQRSQPFCTTLCTTYCTTSREFVPSAPGEGYEGRLRARVAL
jgi:hypothetical protein